MFARLSLAAVVAGVITMASRTFAAERSPADETFTGVFYYQVGRSNGYGPFASFLYAFSGSLMWEYLGEYRERVSANDMIFTPVGGTLFGETFHQISLGVERSRLPRVTRGVLAFVFDPFRRINEWWDRKKPPARRRAPSVVAEVQASEETL